MQTSYQQHMHMLQDTLHKQGIQISFATCISLLLLQADVMGNQLSLILVSLLLLHASSMRLVDQASERWSVMITGEKTWWNRPGYHLSYMEDYPPYPYQRIKSEDGKDTGVVALIAPFYDLTYYRVCVPHSACASLSLLLGPCVV